MFRPKLVWHGPQKRTTNSQISNSSDYWSILQHHSPQSSFKFMVGLRNPSKKNPQNSRRPAFRSSTVLKSQRVHPSSCGLKTLWNKKKNYCMNLNLAFCFLSPFYWIWSLFWSVNPHSVISQGCGYPSLSVWLCPWICARPLWICRITDPCDLDLDERMKMKWYNVFTALNVAYVGHVCTRSYTSGGSMSETTLRPARPLAELHVRLSVRLCVSLRWGESGVFGSLKMQMHAYLPRTLDSGVNR